MVGRTVTPPQPTGGLDWRLQGVCGRHDLTEFFPGEGVPRSSVRLQEMRAKAVCGRCPVRAECAAYALATGEPHGVWGGFTGQERVRLLELGWRDLADRGTARVDVTRLERRLISSPAPRRRNV